MPGLDPVFIGEHVRPGSEMSSKVLAKRDPLEPLGVFGYVDGELRVIEYSDMSDDLSRATWPDGSLKHPYGSIAIHLLDVDFVRRMAGVDLPFHLARKRIPCLGEDGGRIEPDEPNGVKFERFVFDGIPYARSPLIMEVRREEEFAPVKNATGEDSPETARGAMLAQHRRWLEAAGGSVPAGCAVEISPLFALDAEGLQGKVAGLKVTGELYLE